MFGGGPAVLVDLFGCAVLRAAGEERAVFWIWSCALLFRCLVSSSSLSSSSLSESCASVLLLVAALFPAPRSVALLPVAALLVPGWAVLIAAAILSWPTHMETRNKSAPSLRLVLASLSVLLVVLFDETWWRPLHGLHPSLGLRWYFFQELFRPFADFYAVLWLLCVLSVSCALAISLRSHASPRLALGCLFLVASVFAPHVSSLLPILAAVLCWPFASSISRATLLAGPAIQLVFLLAKWSWLHLHAANVNFVYGATLACAGANLFVLTELAALQRSWMLIK